MKRTIRFLLIAIMAAMVLSGCSSEKVGIVAQVDGKEITQEEFDKDFQVYKGLYERQLGEGALDQEGIDGKTMGESLEESILERLIMETLILEDNEAKGIEVTEEDLQEYIEDYKESIGGEESYQQFLQSNSLSDEYFVDNMMKELRGRKHKEDFLSGISISDDQVREFYDENKDNLVEINASHILLGSEEDALSIVERLDGGEDFAQLATTESLDSVSAVNGGNLGYFGKGQMIPEFEEVAFQLNEGEISDVVRTEVGFHIIKVQDKRESLEELKDKVNALIMEEEYYEYVQGLKNAATIKTYLD
jgi:foldase protein PrsA